LKLPACECARFVASLWESIEDPFELPDDYDDDAALRLSDVQNHEIDRGSVQAISYQDLMQRFRQRLSRHRMEKARGVV
jgi:hypothetical protein